MYHECIRVTGNNDEKERRQNKSGLQPESERQSATAEKEQRRGSTLRAQKAKKAGNAFAMAKQDGSL